MWRNLSIVFICVLLFKQTACFANDVTSEADFSKTLPLSLERLNDIGLAIVRQERMEDYLTVYFTLDEGLAQELKNGGIDIGLTLIDKQTQNLMFVYGDFFRTYINGSEVIFHKTSFLSVSLQVKISTGVIPAGHYVSWINEVLDQ